MPPPSRQTMLTKGPIARTLLLFALPILGSTVLQSLNASINAIWIGHYLGEAALSAGSNASLIIFLLLSLVFGVSMASTILVGQSLGARKLDEAKRVVGTGIGFFVALSVIVAVLGYLFAGDILRLLGTPVDAMPYAVSYLRVIFIAIPPMYFFSFLMMTLRGAGDSRTPLAFMALAVLLDVGLNPLLIFGIGPLPRLGIAGSATATLIAQLVSLLALLITLYRRKHFLWLRGAELAYLRPDVVLLRALIFKGLPMGLQMIVITSSAMLMMRLVNAYGSQTVAAYGAAGQLWTYVQMPALAIGMAVSSMAAQNVGARLWDRVARIARVGLLYNLLLTGSLIALIYLFNRAALNIFLPANGAAITQAIHLNGIVIWSFLFFGMTIVLFGVVRSTGAVWPPLIVLFISMWLVRPPFALLLQSRYGSEAIWWSFPLGSLLSVLMATAYYRWGRWKKAHMLAAEPKPGSVEHARGPAAADAFAASESVPLPMEPVPAGHAEQ